VPAAIAGAGLAFPYAGSLLAAHDVANVLFVAASFGIQSFAAAVSARLVYGAAPRRTLLPFALTLASHEVMFVGLTALALAGRDGRGPGAALVLACLVWQLVLTVLCFRAVGGAPRRGLARAVAATCLHYAIIAALVGSYAHAQDLLPYPPGLP